MDKFDDIIRQAVEGHEVPFNPSAWDAINSQLNDLSFESAVNDAVQNYEAPFNASAWATLSSQLGDMQFENSVQQAVENFEAPYNAAAWSAISSELDNAQFENAIKESVQNFEAPVAAVAAWTAITSELDNALFEENIRESVENYTAPHNTSVWDAIVSQLGPSHIVLRWILGSAAVATLVAGGAYLLTADEIVSIDQTAVVADDLRNSDLSNGDETLIAGNDENNTNPSGDPILGDDGENGTDEILNDAVVSDPGSNDGHQTHTEYVNEPYVSNPGNGVQGNISPLAENDVTADDNANSENHNYSAGFESVPNQCCVGESIAFNALYGAQNCQYVWEFSDGTTLYGAEVERTFTKAGSVEVTLELRSNKNNRLLASENNDVTVLDLPVASFTWENSSDVAIPAIHFINTTENHSSLSWNIPSLRTTNLRDFEHTFRSKGTYKVELTAFNDAGCQNTISKEITIGEDYNLLAATGFTPNGDGMNDNFIPAALTILETEFTFSVWSPERGMVYQTKNASEPWDGKITSDNTPARDGGYVWQVQLVNANGETEFYQGQVILTK